MTTPARGCSGAKRIAWKELEPVGVERGVENEHVRLEDVELVADFAHRSGPVHLMTDQREPVDDLLGDGGLILCDQDAGAGLRHSPAS